MSDKAQQIAQLLLQAQAVHLNPTEPFTWTSGWKSPVYCDNRRLLSYPYQRDMIKSELCNEIFTQFEDVSLIAGVATAGIPWATMAADQLKLPMVYVRSAPKAHGLTNQIEGYYQEGQKVVVVEDLISSGKSTLQCIEVLENQNLEIIGVISIFNYGFASTAQLFSEKGIKVLSLSNYPALVQNLIEQNKLAADMQHSLLEWSSNPSQWQPK